MVKIIGYIVAILGAIAIALTVAPIKKLIPISLPEILSDLTITIIGIVLIIIGVLLLTKLKSKQQEAEVPIYKGGQIVGYRRP